MKLMKRTLMLVAAVFVMAAALLTTSTTVQAAKTKKVTLYVGEKPSYGFFLGSVKSVKSSNKKVVAVSKKSGYAILNAKKTGKAKVTVTGTYRNSTNILNVTVKKKPTFGVSFIPLSNGECVMVVKNNSKAFVDQIKLNLTFYDVAGNAVATSTKYVNYVGAGKTAYEKLYASVYGATIDFSKTTAETSYDRSLSYKYKDYTGKVNFSVNCSGGKASVTTSTKYKKDGSVYACFNLAYKDAAGNIVGYYYDSYHYMTKSRKIYTYSYSMPTGAVSAEIVGKRAMLKEYDK